MTVMRQHRSSLAFGFDSSPLDLQTYAWCTAFKISKTKSLLFPEKVTAGPLTLEGGALPAKKSSLWVLGKEYKTT